MPMFSISSAGCANTTTSRRFEDRKCGFYGLDLYSLHASIEAVLAYLSKVDPEAAKRARHYYSCFEHFGKDITTYGYAAGFRMAPSCEEAVVKSLVELRRKAMDYLQRDGQVAADAYFCAEQNALVVRNAEEYYRNMFRREVSSWNLRDTHMMESLVRLANHLSNKRPPAKIIVWAHNSHLGDARATQMGERGELNLGQLVREHFGREAVSIGFTTYDGTVTAASDWDGPAERKNVRPAHPESYEALFHEVDVPNFFLDFRKDVDVATQLRKERLETSHRCNLPARHGIDQSLLSCTLTRSIRRHPALRSYSRCGTTGAHRRMGNG